MTIEATVDEAIAGINRLRKAGSNKAESVESDSVQRCIKSRMKFARLIEDRRIDAEAIDD
jgi:hypothetical protein